MKENRNFFRQLEDDLKFLRQMKDDLIGKLVNERQPNFILNRRQLRFSIELKKISIIASPNLTRV